MNKILSIGDSIAFKVPYLDSYLQYRGEVMEIRYERVIVRYTTELDTHRGYEKFTLTTEIPLSFVVD
ncbi:MAG: hypothetical protein U0264_14290 [Candidatus Kapaibacterium sp.]